MNTAPPIAILEDFRKLSPLERLDVVEAVVQMMRDDWLRDSCQEQAFRQQQLAAAATALRDDYLADPELTVFTSLDGEDFYMDRPL